MDPPVPRHRGAVPHGRPRRRARRRVAVHQQPARADRGRQGPGRRGRRRRADARRGGPRPPEGQRRRPDPEPARLPASGDPMSFATELTRAAAQRGKLDALYQELSDDWTLILQPLFPVWALIGPGLAEPGHIELRSRTLYLDSDELLGTAAELRAGVLERRAILRTYGVAIHEVFHAKHTKLWVTDRDRALAASEDPDERQLAADRALLEEPRMEATGCRAYPDSTRRGRFLRLALGAAVVDCIVPRFAAQIALTTIAGHPVSRDLAGRALTYLHARTHYGVIDANALGGVHSVWQS